MRRLGIATYVIREVILHIKDFQARLPDNFIAVREATEISKIPYQAANSLYTQATSSTTKQVSPINSGTVPCTNPNCTTEFLRACLN